MNVLYIKDTDMRGEIVEYGGKKILWTNEYPAIMFLDDGSVDIIAPNGITMYMNNKALIDEWLDTQDLKYKIAIDAWLNSVGE